jgi:molybdopterin-guanine dinucleotide biosynthesis protein A
MSGAPHKKIPAFVLAGGKSSRMGRDKALLEIAGEPLIARSVRLAASVASNVKVVGGADRLAGRGLEILTDEIPNAGPLAGIATALNATSCDWNLILACDLPYLTHPWLAFLTERAAATGLDAVVPKSATAYEPLCAMYRKSCVVAAQFAVDRGNLRVQDFVAELSRQGRLDTVEPAAWNRFDSGGRLFKNMNEPADYEEAKQYFSASAAANAKP